MKKTASMFFRLFRLRRLTTRAIRIFYSGEFVLTEDNQDDFILRMRSKNSDKELVELYISLSFVTADILHSKSYPPISKAEIKNLNYQIENTGKYFYESGVRDKTLELYRLRAYRNIRLASFYFKIGCQLP